VTRLTYSLEHFGQIGGCIQSFSADFSRVGQGAGQQQVLRATFPGIRDCVRVLLEVRMDALSAEVPRDKRFEDKR